MDIEDHDGDDDLKFDHLTEREILILAVRDLRSVKRTVHGPEGHGARIKKLEDTRIYATGVAAGLGILGVGWIAKLHLLIKAIAEKIPGVHS